MVKEKVWITFKILRGYCCPRNIFQGGERVLFGILLSLELSSLASTVGDIVVHVVLKLKKRKKGLVSAIRDIIVSLAL